MSTNLIKRTEVFKLRTKTKEGINMRFKLTPDFSNSNCYRSDVHKISAELDREVNYGTADIYNQAAPRS